MLSDSHMSVVKKVPKSCESGSSGIINFFQDSKLFVSDPAKMKEHIDQYFIYNFKHVYFILHAGTSQSLGFVKLLL